MKLLETMRSKRDASINLLLEEGGAQYEARAVQRSDANVIYVSAQGGCMQACRMCHLTQQGFTNDRDANYGNLLWQLEHVLYAIKATPDEGQWSKWSLDRPWHIAFMARGEPLASRYLREQPETFGRLRDALRARLATRQPIKVKVSTVGPRTFEGSLYDFFQTADVDVYYSYYSDDPAVRKRWLPKTHEPDIMLRKLADWQHVTHKIPYVHHSLIAGVNDAVVDAKRLILSLRLANLTAASVNIVRYNPFTTGLGEAASAEQERLYVAGLWSEAQRLGLHLHKAQVVQPVGPDVYASCGMFTEGTVT